MFFASIHSRASLGVDAPPVHVEVHLSNGMPRLSIVGLPEAAVKESKDRVRSALLNTQFDFPVKRITINLSPADLPKEGGRFDLPIALGILTASGQLPRGALSEFEFAGELALDGKLRNVSATLLMAYAAQKACRKIMIPRENAKEAALIPNLEIYAPDTLLEVCQHFTGQKPLTRYIPENTPLPTNTTADLCEVRGQYHAKRALEVAAAGGHNLLLYGPPGTGKTMLASRLPGILPTLSTEESIEVAAIASIRGQENIFKQFGQRPFRHPHHTASAVALVGGGSTPKPGEISLAHQGVLFLDEFPEFDRKVLEVLREPLESGKVSISRASHQMEYPAKFQLIAAMNPCPCGYFGSQQQDCRCSELQIQRYRHKLSGPLLDRIDLHVKVQELPRGELYKSERQGETTATVRTRVLSAQAAQYKRQQCLNRDLAHQELTRHASLNAKTQHLLEQAMEKFKLSARAYHRIIRVARTLADLANAPHIELSHLTEALGFREQQEQ